MTLLQVSAFIALTALVAFRARFAWRREPRARIGWMGALLGAGAIFTLGIIVPQELLDAPLGGSNVIKLIQNCLTVVALWLTVQAAALPREARLTTLNWKFPGLLVAIFVVVFACIPDRGPTHYFFVEDGSRHSTSVWMYGVVHMIGTALVAWQLLVSDHHLLGSPAARLFRAGSAAMLVACLSEVLDLTLARLGYEIAAVSLIFDPLFYGGVVIVFLGISTLWRAQRNRTDITTALVEELETMAATRGLPKFFKDDAQRVGDRAHALRIAIEDAANSSGVPLSTYESEVLSQVDTRLFRAAASTHS